MRQTTDDSDSAVRGPARNRVGGQIPAFIIVGLIGYVVDSGVTYACARFLGLPPALARIPGFVVATIVNFLLNRAITFRGSSAPILQAFLRYCAVASAGLVVNYAVYTACVVLAPRVGMPTTPAVLPLYIAAGVGVSMILTFVGFRSFAFR